MESSFFSEMLLQHEDDQIGANGCNFMDYIDEELASILGEHFSTNNLSPAGSDSSSSSALINNNVPQIGVESPAKHRKLNDLSTSSSFSSLKGVSNLNFGDPNLPESSQQRLNCDVETAVVLDCSRNNEEEMAEEEKRVVRPRKANNRKSRVRPPSQTYDHIIAERKRRELLSERFVALSAIVPGLKKMDKTSVLGDSIKYMKQLQEKVQTLEEQVAKQTVESVVLVKRSHIMAEDDNGSSNDKNCRRNEHSLPEIEARVCNRSILLKVHCEKRRGTLMKLLGQVEKLNLNAVTTNVTPFGGFGLHITIIAEMEKEFSMVTEDIVRTLRSALLASS